ncbi:MAG: aminoacyl-histidine dipeptidase [Monoraphidium minutum]|nr:MAG: aminoacyl-histidine dipeptidase [Monoraphidium minutum]
MMLGQALRAASLVRAASPRMGMAVAASASPTAAPPAAAADAAQAVVRGLQPAPVFSIFAEITQIPRASKNEHKVLDWLKQFAAARQLRYRQDAKGNVVIYKAGQAGGEAAPAVILQGHVDMVCEANADCGHDFASDPLTLTLEAGFLKARGTTLGADNGVGVATILAVLDLPPSVPCPPLEALFTVEEEIGLVGAMALDGGMLSGKALLNLDSEDWGVIFIGCAGAGESALTLRVEEEAVSSGEAAAMELVAETLIVSGLCGGHSGLMIADGLANAVQLAAAGVAAVLAAAPGARLVEMRGGDKRNAIPREASADLLVPRQQLDAARAAAAAQQAAGREVFASKEPDLAVGLAPTAGAAGAAGGGDRVALSRGGAQRLLALLQAVPAGVIRMSHALPGMVETSTNLASVKPVGSEGGHASYQVINTTRSAIPAALATERARIAALAALAGAEVVQPADYPGWAPNPASPLLTLAKGVIAKACGHEPQVTAIHAGLECGVLGGVLGGDVDMISFGPNIFGAHSPAERLEVATVQPFWEATLELLGELAKRRP